MTLTARKVSNSQRSTHLQWRHNLPTALGDNLAHSRRRYGPGVNRREHLRADRTSAWHRNVHEIYFAMQNSSARCFSRVLLRSATQPARSASASVARETSRVSLPILG